MLSVVFELYQIWYEIHTFVFTVHTRVREENKLELESRRAVVSREAKKKQHARHQAYATTTVSYLQGW